jgi:hypothetical protein
LFFIGGGVVFDAIAITALFASGSSQFFLPLVLCGVTGASIFSYAYMGAAYMDSHPENQTSKWDATVRWMVTTRPKFEAKKGHAVHEEVTMPAADTPPHHRLGPAGQPEQASDKPPSGQD